MFKKILIANRGEIACRVIKTARRMGIATVAVYSEADQDSLHVRMADEAVAIGPAPSAESYLVIEKILDACKKTGAQAVHPGYGFLSENVAFAEAAAAAGIAFIGPNVEAIAAMGDKIASKKLAKKAKVNTVPGHTGVVKNAKSALEISEKVGFPVMIKASAGGGGKGMRVAWSKKEVEDSFKSAASEAKTSFGDDRIFIEKYIEEPRHIEIQVLADAKGNTIYLGERECSIQRRHQKVIEEAPSPFLDEETRKAMGEQAVALARAVEYQSAGTVEFIVDKDRNFYFLEMNTRLQVEHPVTELITGLDLVELMIRVAAGETLPLGQEDIQLEGWAVETRIYAEDPYRNFLPSIGRLIRYRPPEEDHSVRVDTGVFEGAEISMFYDPMIAKLITYAPDRDGAIESMADALDRFHIRGVNHNIPFLAALMRHPRFGEGRLSTNFIAEEYPDGFLGAVAEAEEDTIFVAVAAAIDSILRSRDATISGQGVQRVTSPAYETDNDLLPNEGEGTVRVVRLDQSYIDVGVSGDPNDCDVFFRALGKRNGEVQQHRVLTAWQPGDPLFQGQVDGQQVAVQIDPIRAGWRMGHAGRDVKVLVTTPRIAALDSRMPVKAAPDTSLFLLSPMPGLLASIAVEEGQVVKAGEELAVVEAMKMENMLRAVNDGVVAKIHAAPGDSLTVDQIIIEFEAS